MGWVNNQDPSLPDNQAKWIRWIWLAAGQADTLTTGPGQRPASWLQTN